MPHLAARLAVLFEGKPFLNSGIVGEHEAPELLAIEIFEMDPMHVFGW